jgi:hypothetical protein
MAHVGTQDLAAALVDARPKADDARPRRTKEQPVAAFYDLRPEGEAIAPDAFRQARALRAAWRRDRYGRLSGDVTAE